MRFRLWYAAQPVAMRTLLAANVVVYLLWQVVLIHIPVTRDFVYQHVALNPGMPGVLFEPWQLLTYAFLHLGTGLGGLLHILFNMLWMVWIGRDYEQMRGPGRFLGVYVLGAVGGALLTVVLHALFPGVAVFGGIVNGASAAVLAIMMTVAIEFPNKAIALMFIGVVRLLYVVWGFIALDILFLAGGGTSVSAHLGGILTGYVLARVGPGATAWAGVFFGGGGFRRGGTGSGSGSARRPRSSQSVLQALEERLANKKTSGGSGTGSAGSGSADSSPKSSRAKDVDAILDKISESGYDSLSAEEKRILYEASGE
ncbi:MAG: rhomboid family intramembrane serine protease [Rhodothermales bacterium]